jgi:hypothetical protein
MFKEVISSAAIVVMAATMVVPAAVPSQASEALPADNPCAGVFNATGSSRKACAPKNPVQPRPLCGPESLRGEEPLQGKEAVQSVWRQE